MQTYLDLVDLPKQRIEKRKCDHQFWLSEPTYLDRYIVAYTERQCTTSYIISSVLVKWMICCVAEWTSYNSYWLHVYGGKKYSMPSNIFSQIAKKRWRKIWERGKIMSCIKKKDHKYQNHNQSDHIFKFFISSISVLLLLIISLKLKL